MSICSLLLFSLFCFHLLLLCFLLGFLLSSFGLPDHRSVVRYFYWLVQVNKSDRQLRVLIFRPGNIVEHAQHVVRELCSVLPRDKPRRETKLVPHFIPELGNSNGYPKTGLGDGKIVLKISQLNVLPVTVTLNTRRVNAQQI